MSSLKSADSKADAKDLLLTDYRNFSEALWRNEQTGETRVNWFIGIVTAAGGGLIGLTSAVRRPHGEPLRLIYVTALFALLCFGVITLFRIFKRNETTDGYKKDSDRIRQMFREHYDDAGILQRYHPFRAQGTQKETLRSIGGLAYTVAILNSLIVAGLAAAFVYPFGWNSSFGAARETRIGFTYVVAAAVFIAAAVGQLFWIRRTEQNSKKRLANTTHAGGIVFKEENGDVEYLLVGPSKENPDSKPEWLFPKGHIDSGEEQWHAAMREVKEETGVVGLPVCPVGSDLFELEKETVKVKYYLIKSVGEVSRTETRRMEWFRLKTALENLTYPGSIQLLHEAERKRRKVRTLFHDDSAK